MAITTIEVRKCDRCGFTHEMRLAEDGWSWASVAAREVNGPFRIGRSDAAFIEGHFAKGAVDLCPSCKHSLDKWFKAGNGL